MRQVECLEDGDEIEGCLVRCGYSTALSSTSVGSAPLEAFDAILLDIMMRRTNGVDVLGELSRKFTSGTWCNIVSTVFVIFAHAGVSC